MRSRSTTPTRTHHARALPRGQGHPFSPPLARPAEPPNGVIVVNGDLGSRMPVGMLVLSAGLLSPAECETLRHLESQLAPLPLLCLQILDPGGLDDIRQEIEQRVSPLTPTVIWATDFEDRCAARLAHSLGSLDWSDDESTRHLRGYPHRPDILNGRHGNTTDSLKAYAERSRANWPHTVRQQRLAYWNRLDEWACTPGVETMPGAAQRIADVLQQWSMHDITAARDLTLDLLGVTALPPLPPGNLRRLRIVNCDVRWRGSIPPATTFEDITGDRQTTGESNAFEVPGPESRLMAALDPLMDGNTWKATDREAIEATLGTPAFITWMGRIGNLPYRQRAGLMPGVADLITQCMLDADLRRLVLAVVEDASTSCDDRITLTWERVRLLVRCQGILRGDFDGDLQHVLTLARQAFRQDALDRIAHGHAMAAGRRFAGNVPHPPPERARVEEIEVHMAFLSQAAGALGIETHTGFGRFIADDISGVSLRDVAHAVTAVKRQENERFVDFLMQWEPWLAVLRRLEPERFAAIDEACADLDQITRWRVDAVRIAAAAGLGGRHLEDAVTRALMQQGLAFRVHRLTGLSRDVLLQQNESGLLDPVWPR